MRHSARCDWPHHRKKPMTYRFLEYLGGGEYCVAYCTVSSVLVNTHRHTHTHTHVWMYVRMHIQLLYHLGKCILVVNVYFLCLQLYIYIYIHIYTHIYTHTHIYNHLIATLLVKKFVVIHENMKFFSLFTKDRHWIQSTVTAYSKMCVFFLFAVLCIKSLEGTECRKSPKKELYSITICSMTVKWQAFSV
jgi:hypothetical protein